MDNLEERMLIEAICASLTDLADDIRSDETASSLALGPQVRDIKRMAENLRNRISAKGPA